MTTEEVFDEIFSTLETQLQNPLLNPYGATALSVIPSFDETQFPTIVLEQFNFGLNRETLNKAEKKYLISIQADVFAINQGTTHARTIANDLTELVRTVLEDTYGFQLVSSEPTPNLVENVYRKTSRFTALVDNDTKVIYRFE